jgi:hypothetical protein
MPGRVNADLLLVGSVPARSTEEAFRAGAAHFGDLVFALPDGETGPRSTWVGYERETLVRPNPAVAVVAETTSPTGFPRHTYESPVFRLRPGTSAVTFGSWPRIDDAIASYREFTALRESAVIPRGLRFQVGLPFPVSALNGLRADFAADYPVAFGGFAGLVERELARLLAVVPAEDLAIQWDIAFETLDIEGVVPWTPHQGGWERFAAAVDVLPRLVPDEVLVGYHLCYGTNPEWPMYEARDMAVLVRMANYAHAASGRPMDWVHMAGPRLLRSEDERFFRPLADLAIGDARVFLGIVLPVDGQLGLRRREATARKFLPDFGVALYCGFRVAPGSTPAEAIQDHEDTIRAVRRLGVLPEQPHVLGEVPRRLRAGRMACAEHSPPLQRGAEPEDRRQRPLVLTSRGEELLAAVEQIYGELEDSRAQAIGAARVRAMRGDLVSVLSDPGDGRLPPIRPPDTEPL